MPSRINESPSEGICAVEPLCKYCERLEKSVPEEARGLPAWITLAMLECAISPDHPLNLPETSLNRIIDDLGRLITYPKPLQCDCLSSRIMWSLEQHFDWAANINNSNLFQLWGIAAEQWLLCGKTSSNNERVVPLLSRWRDRIRSHPPKVGQYLITALERETLNLFCKEESDLFAEAINQFAGHIEDDLSSSAPDRTSKFVENFFDLVKRITDVSGTLGRKCLAATVRVLSGVGVSTLEPFCVYVGKAFPDVIDQQGNRTEMWAEYGPILGHAAKTLNSFFENYPEDTRDLRYLRDQVFPFLHGRPQRPVRREANRDLQWRLKLPGNGPALTCHPRDISHDGRGIQLALPGCVCEGKEPPMKITSPDGLEHQVSKAEVTGMFPAGSGEVSFSHSILARRGFPLRDEVGAGGIAASIEKEDPRVAHEWSAWVEVLPKKKPDTPSRPTHDSVPEWFIAFLEHPEQASLKLEAINRLSRPKGQFKDSPYGYEVFLKPPSGRNAGDLWGAALKHNKIVALEDVSLQTVARELGEGTHNTQRKCWHVNLSLQLFRPEYSNWLSAWIKKLTDLSEKRKFTLIFELHELMGEEEFEEVKRHCEHPLVGQKMRLAIDDCRSQHSAVSEIYSDHLPDKVAVVKVDWKFFQNACTGATVAFNAVVNIIVDAHRTDREVVIEGVEKLPGENNLREYVWRAAEIATERARESSGDGRLTIKPLIQGFDVNEDCSFALEDKPL
ncbi:MAG: hypothetical protein ACD_78C00030G0002 [uncultured bacterium (gcode 4)]|uniref:Uncharacterized protein n=1 Tax=uncultured bacterium (gcode 4) TaxID=1234023 RepID=K1XZA1_9BACT|nr:MAG: hypothetical protein ACD_78C00030G0002 [uncultured bacterium (gcode 4)]